MNHSDPRRELTELEKQIRDYVTEHPRLTPCDIAEVFGHTQAVYYAIPYLHLGGYIDRDPVTDAITPRSI